MNTSNFDQGGVNIVQMIILTLPVTEKLIELQEIRSDFITWMMKWFTLTPSQQIQLQNMTTSFRQELANAIANNYEASLAVTFIKDDKGMEVPDNKNIVVHGLDQWQDPVSSHQTHMLVIPLMIRIQYS